jgi:hypothetical protein
VKSGRFFVTSVILFAMAAAISCDRNRANREHAGQQNKEAKAALVTEGNAKIAEAQTLQKQLAADGVVISSESKSLREHSTRATALNAKLMTLPLAARRDIQSRLAQYLQLINRVIEIDTKNLITIDNRDLIYTSRNSAELLQKSIEEFEKVHGESFDPKDVPQTPAPFAQKSKPGRHKAG